MNASIFFHLENEEMNENRTKRIYDLLLHNDHLVLELGDSIHEAAILLSQRPLLHRLVVSRQFVDGLE